MALINIDIADAVSRGKEFVEALVPVTSGVFGVRLNQNIVGIAIAPASDYAEALLRLPLADGGAAADYMSLTAGTPFLGDTNGILQESPSSPGNFDIVGVIQQAINPADLVNTRDTPAGSNFGVILYLKPPRYIPPARAEYTNVNTITQLTTPLAVGDTVIARVPAVGRKLWHVIVQFTTPANITRVDLRGGILGNGATLVESTLDSKAPTAGFVEFAVAGRPAWHTMAVVVTATGASNYRLIYRLEDETGVNDAAVP